VDALPDIKSVYFVSEDDTSDTTNKCLSVRPKQIPFSPGTESMKVQNDDQESYKAKVTFVPSFFPYDEISRKLTLLHSYKQEEVSHTMAWVAVQMIIYHETPARQRRSSDAERLSQNGKRVVGGASDAPPLYVRFSTARPRL
jgi:hypothetical protein